LQKKPVLIYGLYVERHKCNLDSFAFVILVHVNYNPFKVFQGNGIFNNTMIHLEPSLLLHILSQRFQVNIFSVSEMVGKDYYLKYLSIHIYCNLLK